MPPARATSTARLYFEEIRNETNPFEYLSGFPFPPRPEPFFEGEWIDFKGSPRNDDDTKKIWSKALSGFANITDGLVIWGIDARKTGPRNIDAASGLQLIPDPHALESKLRDYIRDATNPPVLGVEYQSYPGPTGAGFVVCLVPESSHKPHRAEWAGRHYYYRAGDDFLVAEPGLLRTLFYPQLRPQMWISVTLKYELRPPDLDIMYRGELAKLQRTGQQPNVGIFNTALNARSAITMSVILGNNGPATAKEACVVVETDCDINYYSSNREWNMLNSLQGKVAYLANRSFHPGEVVHLFNAGFQQEFHNTDREPQSWEVRPHFNKISLRFLIYSEGAERQELLVEFVPDDLDYPEGATKEGVLVG